MIILNRNKTTKKLKFWLLFRTQPNHMISINLWTIQYIRKNYVYVYKDHNDPAYNLWSHNVYKPVFFVTWFIETKLKGFHFLLLSKLRGKQALNWEFNEPFFFFFILNFDKETITSWFLFQRIWKKVCAQVIWSHSVALAFLRGCPNKAMLTWSFTLLARGHPKAAQII